VRPRKKASTRQTKGMMSSLAICMHAGAEGQRGGSGLWQA
jgi:hypothetical protein